MSLNSQNDNPCGSTYRKEELSAPDINRRATQDLPIQDLRRRLVQIAKQRDLTASDLANHRGAVLSPTRDKPRSRFVTFLRRAFGLS